MNAGHRLMLLGALVLGGVCIYFLADQPSKAELKTDNFIIETQNEMIRLGLEEGQIEHRSAEQMLAQRRKPALWAAGVGLLLLGVGWAVSGGQGPKKHDGSNVT